MYYVAILIDKIFSTNFAESLDRLGDIIISVLILLALIYACYLLIRNIPRKVRCLFKEPKFFFYRFFHSLILGVGIGIFFVMGSLFFTNLAFQTIPLVINFIPAFFVGFCISWDNDDIDIFDNVETIRVRDALIGCLGLVFFIACILYYQDYFTNKDRNSFPESCKKIYFENIKFFNDLGLLQDEKKLYCKCISKKIESLSPWAKVIYDFNKREVDQGLPLKSNDYNIVEAFQKYVYSDEVSIPLFGPVDATFFKDIFTEYQKEFLKIMMSCHSDVKE